MPATTRRRLSTGDEDVLAAVVVERFPVESAIESFEVQARDVEESQPFVLGCPPERAGSTVWSSPASVDRV